MQTETEIEFEKKSEYLLQSLNSAEELRDWMHVYLDLYFPNGIVYPTSTHGPVEAMWRIYELMKTGENEFIPQACMLASRDSFKTLGAAALEILCMLHFRISVAHMAAISSQSDKAIQYVTSFFRKLRPYLEENGWKQSSDNKKMVAWLTNDLQEVYIRIVIATIAGANCLDPDTIVETKEGNKKASDVIQGDLLKTYDLWNQKEVYVKVMTTGEVVSETREFIFEDGSNLITSVKHKVFTQKGWLNSGNLQIGDRVVNNGSFHKTQPKESAGNKIVKWRLESVVYGTLLGSASLQKLPSGKCRYQVFHSSEHLSYLERIKETFEENNIKATIIPHKEGYRLYTEVCDYFNSVYRRCYLEGKRSPNANWMSQIDIQALAFLVMDSGTAHRKELGKYKENPIDINTMGFLDSEIELVVSQIKELGYFANTRPVGKHTQVRIPIQESRDLSEDVVSYFVDDLKYKLCFTDDIRFAIDTGNFIDNRASSTGFPWEDPTIGNLKKGRDFKQHIKIKLNKKITKINHIGVNKLVGIGIDPRLNFNIKSFYANGNLVHNSEHVPMLFIDEVDVVQDPRALKEAKMIPSVFGKWFPLTVYLSTRKFAGGLMEKTLKQTITAGGEILRWNILDVTERIPHDVARIDEPRQIRYISTNLPMESLLESEWNTLPDERKHKYERLEAYAGIADHPLLPVMRNYLVDRPQEDHGGLFKKLSATLNNFRQIEPDMADAQLLCNKPSSSGLVYPRFDEVQNVLSVQEAWEKISGLDTPCDFNKLRQYLLDLGVTFIGGGDWGFTDYTANDIGRAVRIRPRLPWL